MCHEAWSASSRPIGSSMADRGVHAPSRSCLPTAELVARLKTGAAAEAGAVLARLVAEEERLVLDNRMKPYVDQVPGVVTALPANRVAAILDTLPTATVKRALFGNFTRIPDPTLRAVVSAMQPRGAAALMEAMAVGIDAPREMARVLAGDGFGRSEGEIAADLRRAVQLAHPVALVRLFEELEEGGQARLADLAGAAHMGAVVAVLEAMRNRVHAAWAAELLAAAENAGSGDCEGEVGAPPRTSARRLRADLGGASPREAAAVLAGVSPRQTALVLRMLTARRAADVLMQVAGSDPGLAADLLDAVNVEILVRPPQGETAAWWLQDCPAAGIVEALDLGIDASRRLLASVRPERLSLILDRVPGSVREGVEAAIQATSAGHLSFSFEVLGVARGERRTKRLEGGLRWVHIEEMLDTGIVRKPVVIDLLEMPAARVQVSARMAVDDARALPAGRAAEVFEGYRRAGERPSSAAFASAGLTQLSRAVASAGALAAINGNFYFDYGHYLNGVTLGIDVANVPGLFFGDPIGWFIAGGTQVIPPAFNRAAGLVTEDGAFHIERVFMTDVRLADGRRARWETVNVPKSLGRTGVYTSLFGYRTEPATSHVDVAIARERVWSVSPEGSQVIPLTGLVLSVPAADPDHLLPSLQVGASVFVSHDFPARHGRVMEAMACGPSLVRSGSATVDFGAEDFGQQDSTVMSFFLPRTVETYEAARSFLARRDDTLIFGTVSGTAYGFGRTAASGGMTFGELAQLCVDLRVDSAYALDGGGSSSLVARDDGTVRVLNSPTGGADVGQGEERFINTYWLVFGRKDR